MRILVADDAGFIRDIICQVYLAAGHEIIGEATNGPDTILFALERRPDLILMDLVLPELNGFEAAKEISSQESEIMIVAMSSLDQDWVQESAKKAGCRYFLRKPFTREELLEIVDRVGGWKEEGGLKHG